MTALGGEGCFFNLAFWAGVLIWSSILVGGIGLLYWRNWARELLITAFFLESLLTIRMMFLLHKTIILGCVCVVLYLTIAFFLFSNLRRRMPEKGEGDKEKRREGEGDGSRIRIEQ
jgi:hypothetical protein